MQERDRHEEADLLRSPLKIYVTHYGTVKPRIVPPKLEQQFVSHYLDHLLDQHLANDMNPLSWSFDRTSIHPTTREELTRRAVAFVNDVHPHAKVLLQTRPSRLAELYALSSNQSGHHFENADDLDELSDSQKKALNDRADLDDAYHVKEGPGKKVVRDREMRLN